MTTTENTDAVRPCNTWAVSEASTTIGTMSGFAH
jgi:hypothetical protein